MSTKIKKILKTQGEVQRNFNEISKFNDISCSRCFTIKNILIFDLGYSRFLFEINLTFKPEKYLLVTEIEKYVL